MSTMLRRSFAMPTASKRPAIRLLAVLFVLTAIVAPLVRPESAFAESAVTTSSLNLRGGPSTSENVRLVMPEGASVEVTGGPRNGFYKVVYQGREGWASGEFLSIGGGGSDGGSSGSTSVLSALNLRSGPSTSDSVILVMPDGARVDLTGERQNGFLGVVYRGTSGWASAEFLDGSTGVADEDGGGSLPGGSGGGSATVDSALNLRSGASTSSSVILVMPGGADVELTGDEDNGFLGVIYNGRRGWAFADYLNNGGGGGSDDGGSLPGGSGGGNATVESALNLRNGPSTSNSVMLVMPGGAEVELTGDESNGFLGVIYNGQRGWASAQYLIVGGSSDGGNDGGGSWDGSDGWSTDEIIAIIYDAAAQWGQNGDDMLRVAQCESGLDPYNVTPPYSASGLFQFLPGTWASTPYANDDIFDPVASANATGWMWSVGRRGEWVCQ